MPDTPSPFYLALQDVLAGRFALERELGRGGMGIVYLARDLSLDRPVAIKVLPPALAARPALRARFLREARIAASLSHPHIVPIHSVEEHGDLALFVMAYVEGETLGQRIARGEPVTPEDGGRILQEVAWALAYAHQRGVVHRDIKPDNILLERGSGRALVSDFGIAQVADAAAVTDPDIRVGTERYMSPEQKAGGPLDGRSDLFSLGVTALVVFRTELPQRLAPIIERCLAEAPDARFADGEALAEALGATRGHQLAVPIQVERFVDLYKTMGVEISTYAAILMVLAGESLALAEWGNPLFPTVLVYALFVAIGLGVLRSGQLIARARELFARGYSAGDVHRALDRTEPVAERTSRAVGRVRALVGVAAAGIWVALWPWWASRSRGALIDGVIFALLTLVPVVPLRNLFSRLMRPGRKGWWSRLWWKVMEWKVFRIARLGTGARPHLNVEPTEVMLEAGARELFSALPSDTRRRLAEVPDLLERLEGRARELRERGADADRERLAATLGAMEQLRLDLLRLRAGTATSGGLTEELDAARDVGERIDRLLDGIRRLESPTPTPVASD